MASFHSGTRRFAVCLMQSRVLLLEPVRTPRKPWRNPSEALAKPEDSPSRRHFIAGFPKLAGG
jgi:hypothetical protein